MCAEKNNDQNNEKTGSGCCDGMAEIMKNCCPDGISGPDCFAKMKDKFCGQKTDGESSKDGQDCCG